MNRIFLLVALVKHIARSNLRWLAIALLFGGCATAFQPSALSPNHPANPQAREGVRQPMPRLSTEDKLTSQAEKRLSEKAPVSGMKEGGQP